MAIPIKPSQKYEHLYAIIRYEREVEECTPIDLRITVKKIVTDANYAKKEVERLNRLNADKGAYYFSHVTRFESPPVDAMPVASVDIVSARVPDQHAT